MRKDVEIMTRDINSYILTQQEINEIISIYKTNNNNNKYKNQYNTNDYYVSYRELADIYGVSKSTIENIINKYNFK